MIEPRATLLTWEAPTGLRDTPYVIGLAFETADGSYHTTIHMRGSFLEWLIQQTPERQAEVKAHFLKVLGQHFDHATKVSHQA
jgi:hypothetical protein